MYSAGPPRRSPRHHQETSRLSPWRRSASAGSAPRQAPFSARRGRAGEPLGRAGPGRQTPCTGRHSAGSRMRRWTSLCSARLESLERLGWVGGQKSTLGAKYRNCRNDSRLLLCQKLHRHENSNYILGACIMLHARLLRLSYLTYCTLSRTLQNSVLGSSEQEIALLRGRTLAEFRSRQE